MPQALQGSSLRPESPDFLDFPWHLPFGQWADQGIVLEDLPIGLCRHPVIFVRQDDQLYALKALPDQLAEQEYQLLRQMEELHLPAVQAMGHLRLLQQGISSSVLITRYLDESVPYRLLFVQPDWESYREHLLDAMASLLVELHLKGIFWGDCSLSNTLFKRDAGRLQAYLVDAETSEFHDPLSDNLRDYELDLMEENISGALADLAAAGDLPADFDIFETGSSIRQRYGQLWDEINRTELIQPDQKYRIQERIRKLNQLGFSVDEVWLQPIASGDQLQVRVMVTDRHFNKGLLQGLTGLEAEEQQAQRLINEIQEIRAELSQAANRSVALSVAAQRWLEQRWQPLHSEIRQLQRESPEPLELYCLMLEHKWYLSEKAGQDVGHHKALQDYVTTVLSPPLEASAAESTQA